MKYIDRLCSASAILSATGAFAAGQSGDAGPVAGKQPHIILIMTDQQRADALGCAGNPSVITPNIDRLAGDGLLFSNAYSSTPSSTPARAGLLTGLSPWNHGMLGYGRQAEHYKYEMPRMMRELGYMTLGIGKMHWNPQDALHGFHAVINDESGRRESPYFTSDYRKWFYVHALGLDPDATGLGWNDHRARVYALPEELHPTRWTGDTAVETIENYTGDAPLFLKVSFARPHSPYDPPQRVLDLYDGVEIPAPAEGEWSARFAAMVKDPQADTNAAYGNFGVEYAKNTRRHYYAAVTFIDEQVGRIIEALKERDMYDNALVFFISDHGDMMGDHSHWRKTYAYEGSAAVPFIAKFPAGTEMKAFRPGDSPEYPVELRDLLPTMLAVNGQQTPADMDGASLTKLFTDGDPAWRRWIDLEHATCYSRDNYWCALTDGKMKYIWFLRTGEEQLFDLAADPHETKELSNDAEYRRQLEELRAAMTEHLKIRGEGWVKDGKLVTRTETMLYSPNFPAGK